MPQDRTPQDSIRQDSIQTCYRHSDRRAGVRCQRCDRPICPSCMNQASVGFHCPECAKTGRQKVYTARSLVSRPVVTTAIVAINVVVFVLEVATGSEFLRLGGSVGDVARELGLFGPAVADGDWWRPVTSGFVHFGLIHLGFNMFILWQLGMMLESAIGRVSYAMLYSLALMGGSTLVLVLDPDALTAGASGAVFGLMGAAFVGLRARGIDPFSTSIGPLLAMNLLLTFTFGGISIGGHIGGLIAGAAGGWLLLDLAPRIPNGKVIAPVVCGVATVALFVASLVIASNPI